MCCGREWFFRQSAKILGHDLGGCAQDLREWGWSRGLWGATEPRGFGRRLDFTLGNWQSFEGRQLSLAAAWSEQEAGGQVQWRRSQQRRPGMPWAGQGLPGGLDSERVPWRTGRARVSTRHIQCFSVWVPAPFLRRGRPRAVGVPFGTCWANML